MRQLISSGSPYEESIGYSRAVRSGPFVFVSGTTGLPPAGESGDVDAGAQATRALERIAAALTQAGASLEDVVRSTIYLSDRDDVDAISAAHGAVFGTIRPAATMVLVDGLIDPAMLVEIEVTAVLP